MTYRWHRLNLVCSRCNNTPTILALSSSADGAVLLEMICVHCGINLTWTSDFAKLITRAFQADLEEGKPIRPPLALEKLADEKFLRNLHIDPDNPKEGA